MLQVAAQALGTNSQSSQQTAMAAFALRENLRSARHQVQQPCHTAPLLQSNCW